MSNDSERGLNRHDRQLGESTGIAGAAGGLIGALVITPLVAAVRVVAALIKRSLRGFAGNADPRGAVGAFE